MARPRGGAKSLSELPLSQLTDASMRHSLLMSEGVLTRVMRCSVNQRFLVFNKIRVLMGRISWKILSIIRFPDTGICITPIKSSDIILSINTPKTGDKKLCRCRPLQKLRQGSSLRPHCYYCSLYLCDILTRQHLYNCIHTCMKDPLTCCIRHGEFT